MSVFLVFLSIPRTRLIYHHEKQYVNTDNPIVLEIDSIADCNVTIRFADDPSLMYSIDIGVYEHSMEKQYELEVTNSGLFWNISISGHSNVNYRLRSINVTLGSIPLSEITIGGSSECSNVFSNVKYGDNVLLSGSRFVHDIEDSILLLYVYNGSNIDFGGLEANVIARSSTTYTFLPNGINGIFEYFSSPSTSVVGVGWDLISQTSNHTIYETPEVDDPVCKISVTAEEVIALLMLS